MPDYIVAGNAAIFQMGVTRWVARGGTGHPQTLIGHPQCHHYQIQNEVRYLIYEYE